jgi:hypothetical protein
MIWKRYQPWLGAGYRIGPDQSAGVVRGYASLSEANPAQSLLVCSTAVSRIIRAPKRFRVVPLAVIG